MERIGHVTIISEGVGSRKLGNSVFHVKIVKVKNLSLFYLSVVVFLVFTAFSYTVAKEYWQKIDFDTTVKFQDHFPRRVDEYFSLVTLFGSPEFTVLIAGIMAFLSLIRKKILAFIGWSLIVPATIIEVFGKFVLYHPAPPNFLLRSIDLEKNLPHFYVHTDYSYPSGHLTRTVFISTIFFFIILTKVKDPLIKFSLLSALIGFCLIMFISRIYLGEHWFSDVVGGTLLGLSSGLFASFLIIGKKKLTASI
jgi:membrane-associated phospholipid phosphatase